MLRTPKKFLLVLGLLLLLLTLAACAQAAPEATPCPECPDCPTCPTCPDPVVCPEVIPAPFEDAFKGSPHADAEAEAFNHWNEDGAVETACANCHSAAGYQDFLGADGSAAGVVDSEVPAPAGTLSCDTCHNAATLALTAVTFPSGVTIENLGDASRCMVCHQGRESKISVDAQIERFGVAEALDEVVEPIKDDAGNDVRFGFRNIHYFAAAATLYGTEVKGGYEYEGMTYDAKNAHVEGYDSCIGCHDPHTLEIKINECAVCHEGVASTEDIKNIRMVSSAVDYDGDGDISEGIYYEIVGLQEALFGYMQGYASQFSGMSVAYDSAAYPYFFADADGDGKADTNDSGAVRFTAWTPRLLKAAYNYQVSIKDAGAHAHGGKYIIQLLYDSIVDLDTALESPADTALFTRDDHGHFAGSKEPFRHWDEDGEVPGRCAKCHSSTGLPTFLKEGVNVSAETANGFMCSTCHNEAAWPAVYEVASVTFPSGKVVSFAQDADGKNVADPANLCISCHQGNSSKAAVDKALGTKEVDTVDATIRFANIHYFAAGATVFGTEVQGAYEYDGKTYLGQNPHPGNESVIKCTACHDKHELAPNVALCQGCHGTTDPQAIRSPGDTVDYDGDGNTTEGTYGEISTLADALYAEIQKYAEAAGTPITYDAHTYPYFLKADGSGGYNAFTPRLLKAAYNYQYVQKDPGAYVHNPKYVIQFLIDGIEDLGGDITAFTRP